MAGLMVAGAVLGPFVQTVLDLLVTQLIDEFNDNKGIKEDLEKLAQTVRCIRLLLQDADSHAIKDKSTGEWLSKLEFVTYDADDVLDDFYYEFMGRRIEDRGRGTLNNDDNGDEDDGEQGSIKPPRVRKRDKVMKAFSSITSMPSDLRFHRKLSKEIRRICDELDDIGKLRRDFKLEASTCGMGGSLSKSMRVTSCLPSEPFVIGREVETEKIIEIISGSAKDKASPSSSQVQKQQLPVLSIVGIAGIGKTTLAQIVYNSVDRKVKGYFDLMMWVCVGEIFDVEMVTEQIYEYVATSVEKSQGFRNLSFIQEKLREKLKERRFLLVLDDVWNESRSEWLRLQAPLLSGREGSIVLVTTRNLTVAKNAMGNDYQLEPIRLGGLSFEDCLSLFLKSVPAALDNYPQDNQILHEICGKIVDKLTGVPLAVKTIGSFLSSPAGEGRWKDVLEMEIWDLPQSDGDVLPVLKLSYEELPLHLKACFSYCSLFPKNHGFIKSKLAKHWIAHNYLPRKGRVQPEYEESECFNEFLSRSFFVEIEDRYFIPGLYHELAQYVSSRECLRVESQDSISSYIGKEDCVRHLSFSSVIVSNATTSLEKFSNLRSLIHIDHHGSQPLTFQSDKFFSNMPRLRVLDLSGSIIDTLPSSVGSLTHLRFLDLSYSQIQVLPQSISKLYNLYFLDLNGCSKLKTIDQGVTNLINIKHLRASRDLLSQLQGIGKLTDLQSLEHFGVSKLQDITELKGMNNLRGSLHIFDLQNVGSEADAKQARLKRKKNLDELVLEWSLGCGSASDVELQEKILDNLVPPIDVKSLSIRGHRGRHFPSWMTSHHFPDSLENLTYLKMEYLLVVETFSGTKTNMFPSLKVLVLRHLHELHEWLSSKAERQQESSVAFPKLQQLVIEDCPRLENIAPIPNSLKSFKIDKCPGLLKNLLSKLQPLESVFCSSEYRYPNLLSCCEEMIKHLFGLEGLEICSVPKEQINGWSLRPTWMPFTFAQGRPADEIKSPKGAENVHDISDTRIFLLYAHNFPEYPRPCRRACVRFRNHTADSLLRGYDLLSTCFQDNLTSLKHLSVKGCENVESLLKEQDLLSMTNLENLEIDNCKSLMRLEWIKEVKQISSLKTLVIRNCQDLTSFPGLKLPKLVELQVQNCENLTTMDLKELLACLEPIEIVKCPSLKGPLFVENAPKLQDFKVWSCAQLFASSGEMDEEFRNLTSLCLLEIRNCEKIMQLPTNLHTVNSLKHLSIMQCSAISALPDNGLPTSLEKIRIEGCPILQDRCRRNGGLDWSKISAIPDRNISCAKCYPRDCLCDLVIPTSVFSQH